MTHRERSVLVLRKELEQVSLSSAVVSLLHYVALIYINMITYYIIIYHVVEMDRAYSHYENKLVKVSDMLILNQFFVGLYRLEYAN